MTSRTDDQEREWQFFGEVLDPLVRDLLALDDPWAAYRCANEICGFLTDTSPNGSFSLPHAGGVYVAWAELADLFETGRTPIADAHAMLRLVAQRWLARPSVPSAGFVEQWTAETAHAVGSLFDRDGNWWRNPE